MYYVKRYLVPVILLIVSLISFTISGKFRYEPTDMEKRCTVSTTATVVDVRTTPSGEQDIVTMHYKDHDTWWTLDLPDFVEPGEYTVDQEVPIRYNSAKTTEFIIDVKHQDPVIRPFLMGLSGVLFGVSVAWVVISLLKRGV